MKNVMVALLCTLGAVAACSDRRPAESPTTTTSGAPSTTTTVTDTTLANSNPGTASGHAATVGDTNAANGANATGAANGATNGAQPRTYPQPSPVSPLGAASTDGSTAGTGSNGSGAAMAGTPSNGDPNATNTKKNERDRNAATVTPMDQGGGKDRDITAAIRRAVVADSAVSFNGKNVKIITKDGHVTLRGPVKTDAEKANIEQKTRAAAGVIDVDNQLEVKK